MVRPATLVYFYRKRLRVHGMQELLAGLGIAVGVALVFGVLIVNASVTGGADRIVGGLSGDATLRIAARSASGFDERTVAAVKTLPGVARTTTMLWQRASIVYRGRREPISFGGFPDDFTNLSGLATRQFGRGGPLDGLLMSVATADRLRVRGGDGPLGGLPVVTLDVHGHRHRVPVGQVLGKDVMGPLAASRSAIVRLRRAQRLAGLPARVTYMFVVPRPGQHALARAGLERIAGARLTVGEPEDEVRALDVSLQPIKQAQGLFALVSLTIGLLLAWTAMVLTVPERRRFVAELRVLGFSRERIVQVLAFQAVVLGALASAVGLPLGHLLAGSAVRHPPGYLDFAYPLSTAVTVSWGVVATAFVAGLVTSCLAAAQPLLDLRRSKGAREVLAHSGEPGQSISLRVRRTLALGWAPLLVVGLLLARSSQALPALATIVVAMVAAIPSAFTATLWLSDRVASRWRRNSLALAVRALHATSLRSLALVTTAAVAIYGAVWIEGVHHNLLVGLREGYRAYVSTADVWIAQPGDDLGLLPFDGGDLRRRVAAVPGVREVRDYGGGLLEIDLRRVWVIARPDGDVPLVPAAQVVAGDARKLASRLRAGGWITVSREIARAEGVGPGDVLELPTPTGPVAYRVAATTTNMGWGAGAIVMNRRDQRRAWGGADPTALEVDLADGADLLVVQQAIRRVLGPRSGLQVQSASEREQHANAVARASMAMLGRMTRLVLVAAALSVAAAMGAGIWQRRRTLAQLRVMGWRPAKLWRALLWEAALVLGTASVMGSMAGVCGHYAGDRWLQDVAGFSMPFAVLPGQMVSICLLVFGLALAVAAVPGAIVSRTPPRMGLDG